MLRRARESSVDDAYDPADEADAPDVDVAFSCMAEPPRARYEQRSVQSPMQLLVMLQRADGSWALTREFARVLGRDVKDLRAALPGGSEGDALQAWATAQALAWLEVHAADRRDEWEMLAAKANAWLRHVPDPALTAWMWPARAVDVVRG